MGFAQPPIIFLVAGPRGRTPVCRLLDTHKRVAIVPDSAWVTDLAAQRHAFEAPGGAKAFADAFVEHRTSGAWGFAPDQVRSLMPEDGPYIALVRAIFNAYAERVGASVLVDASPHVTGNLHLLTSLTKRARVLIIREPGLGENATSKDGYETWLSGRGLIDDALATLDRSRWTATKLDELLKDPVGVVKTLVAYLEVGLGLDGFGPVDGLPVATRPGRVLRLGPQAPGAKEAAPLRAVRAFAERYPKAGRTIRRWAERNRPLAQRALKKLRKGSR